VPIVRERLTALHEAQPAPSDNELFNAARNWSLAHRYDPEFLTDAFLIAVIRANPEFEHTVANFGINSIHLEQLLRVETGDQTQEKVEDPGHALAVFARPDSTGEMDVARVMDANFNRAREAARALEDYCRFIRNDRFLTAQIKDLRHNLAEIFMRIPPGLLLTARETLQDVGTTVTALSEYERNSPSQVATANLKRLQESLRTLEEFGKLFAQQFGRDFESVRYRAYTLEKALCGGSHNREKMARAKLYALLTGSQCHSSLDWTVERAVAGGVDIIQLREKTLSDRELLARARDMRRWTHEAGVLFILNDRPDIARLCDADGVHLGQDDLSIQDARRILGSNALIGKSTHSIEQVRQAVLEGADYLGIGPVFPSSTKSFDNYPGLEFIRAASAETSLAAFALGGITPANLEQVVSAGAKRIAVGSAIAKTDDPEQVSRFFRTIIDNR
jgi:thiamine-phosphate pyrophosphorylase